MRRHDLNWRAHGVALLLAAAAPAAWAHVGEEAGPGHPWWSQWNGDAWLWLLLAASGAAYAAGVGRLWRSAGPGRGISRWRAACFGAGWLALVLALLSPLDPLGSLLFWVHMIQHEVLMLVAAPLLAIGYPLAAWVWALPRGWRQPARAAVERGGLRAAVRWLSRPLVAWSVQALVLWGWHAPPLFERALRSEGMHIVQHLSFFGSALLFSWSVLRPGLRRQLGVSTLAIVTTAMHTGVLGALLTFAPTAWYGTYATTAPALGWSALEDQQLGGLIMWVPAGTLYVAAALATFSAWLSAAAASPTQLRPLPMDGG